MRRIYVDLMDKEYRLAEKIDYVAGWFFKAAEFIESTKTKVALVSTNSTTQGEQVVGVWKPLYDRFSIEINFAYKKFKWDNESSQKSQVHVVIIGFSHNSVTSKDKRFSMNRINLKL